MSRVFNIDESSFVDSEGVNVNPVFYDLKDDDPAHKQLIKTHKLSKKDISPALNVFVLSSYILSDMQKKPRSYRIGVFTITLTITFVILLYCVLDVLPVVFLKLAQNQAGESDFVYTAQSNQNVSYSADTFMYNISPYLARKESDSFELPLLNATEFIEKTKHSDDFEGFSPRWLGVADFANTSDPDLYTPGLVMIIDTEQEVRIGLGRDFTKTLLGKNQVFMTSSTLRYLDIEPNGRDEVELVIDIRDYLSLLFDTNHDLTEDDIEKIFEETGRELDRDEVITIVGADIVNRTELENELNGVDVNETVNDAEQAVEDIVDDEETMQDIQDSIDEFEEDNNVDFNQTIDDVDQEQEEGDIDLSFIDDIEINITVQRILDFVIENQEDLFVLRIKLSVVESYDAPNGKFMNSYGNVMVMDSAYIVETLTDAFVINFSNLDSEGAMDLLSDSIADSIEEFTDIEINDYAMQIDGVLKDREYYYLGTPKENKKGLLEVQKDLNLQIKSDADTPVATAIEGFYFLGLFLESIFATIVFFMVILSIMLIHSLMISDVDEKTYEMGMFRALGLRTVSLMQLIVIQSTMFSVPGILLGVVISTILNVFSRYITFTYTVSYTTYMIAPLAATLGVLIGILMPLGSNIWAIKRALGKKIRDSLDIFHTGISDVLVKIIKLENFGISPFEAALGVTLVFMGVMTYYMAPAAFLFDRLDIFFFILNIVLVGMILGMAFLCFLIFPTIQSLIVLAICNIFRFDLKLQPLVMKNLNHSHKKRNAKTTMLFTVSLAFLVFSGSSLLLMGNLIVGLVKNSLGADIFISSYFSDNSLPETDLREFLDREKSKSNPFVNDYAFVGEEFSIFLDDIFNDSYLFYLTSGGSFPYNHVRVFPVEQRFLHSTLTEFYLPEEVQKGVDFPSVDGKEDLVWGLYNSEGTTEYGGDLDKFDVISTNLTGVIDETPETPDPTKQVSMLLPLGIKDVLSIEGGSTIELEIEDENDDEYTTLQSHRLLVRGLPKKMPGFFFMSYKQVQFFLDGMISFEAAEEILQLFIQKDSKRIDEFEDYKADTKVDSYTYNYPKRRLLIDVRNSISKDDREVLVNQLGGLLRDDTMVILDVIAVEENISSSLGMMEVFMVIVGIVSFTVSFFLLLVSTASNIRENIWEFGVLRAIGLRKGQIIRVYLYESLAVTITSIILGLTVGFLIAFTLSLQFNLFLELPFFITFPYMLVGVMLVLAFVTTVAGTVFPLMNVNNRPIAEILKAAA